MRLTGLGSLSYSLYYSQFVVQFNKNSVTHDFRIPFHVEAKDLLRYPAALNNE